VPLGQRATHFLAVSLNKGVACGQGAVGTGEAWMVLFIADKVAFGCVYK
jgi:hypothetical protein